MAEKTGGIGSAGRQARIFAILFALMLVNHLDRQVMVSILPLLKPKWSLSDIQLGGLVSIVSISVAAGVVPFSVIADRWSRVHGIALMAFTWSLATIACAFCTSYTQLLLARGLVGVGEAAFGTAGAALVASLFSARLRSTMLGAFLAAAVLGAVVGVVMGGVVATRWGWQAAFVIAGVPGLVLAILFWTSARGIEPGPRPGRSPRSMTMRQIFLPPLRSHTVLAACVGGGLQLVVVSTMYAWLPSYFNRYHGLPADQAGVWTGALILVGGPGAVLISNIADRLTRRMPLARLYVPAVAAGATTFLLCGAFADILPSQCRIWLLAAGGLVMTGTIGPIAAVIVDVSPPELRATSTSILTFFQNLLGLGAGPLLAGALADEFGLRIALSVIPVFSLLAATSFVFASHTYLADMRGAAEFEQVSGAPA